MKQLTAILLGAGQRGNAYSDYALQCPNELKIVGVAEPDDVRRKEYQDKHKLPESQCYKTWQEVFARDKWADIVMICTQDTMHYEPAMAAIDKGYDILLEKPIAPTAKECKEIADAALAKNVKIIVCHGMRYTNVMKKLKEIIDSDEIGSIASIVHCENVGDIHHSHSYVRGNWGNTERSSPMLLAKSCHDLDFIQWLVGEECVRVSSFGSLSYFKKENCPDGAPPRCTDGCTIDCTYDARKLYVESDSEWFRSVAAGHYRPTDEEVGEAIKTGPYGRCVFQCDNDVVDHQVVSMEFKNDVTVIFSMSGLTPVINREIKVMCTRGIVTVCTDPPSLIVTKFVDPSKRESQKIEFPQESGHGGGDIRIMRTLCAFIRGDSGPSGLTEIGASAKNHMLCFAAEHSRLSNGAVVELQNYIEEL